MGAAALADAASRRSRHDGVEVELAGAAAGVGVVSFAAALPRVVVRGRRKSGRSAAGVGSVAGVAASIAAEAAARRSRQDGVDAGMSAGLGAAVPDATPEAADVRRVVERVDGLAAGFSPAAEPESPGKEANVDWKPLSRSSIERPLDGVDVAPARADGRGVRVVNESSAPGSDSAAKVDANVAKASSTGWDDPPAPADADAPPGFPSAGSMPSIESSGLAVAISTPLSGTVVKWKWSPKA